MRALATGGLAAVVASLAQPAQPLRSCDILPQVNCVTDLATHRRTVKLLGASVASPEACRDACAANSTPADPCRVWTYVYADSPQPTYRGHCYGRHDEVWDPVTVAPAHNHVCSAVSCLYAPPTTHPPAPPPTQPPGTNTPAFSWARVPTYSFPCFDPTFNRTNQFSDANITFLAQYQIVILCHGYWDDNGKLIPAEVAMTDAATRIKAKNPSVNVIFYKNSVLDWNDYAFHAKLAARPEILARRSDGQPTKTPGDRHFARAEPPGGMWSVDFAQAAGRDFWASEVLNATNSRPMVFDGVFADRGGSTPADLAPNATAAYVAGHNLVLQMVQQKIKGGGILIANNDFIPGIKATMIEGFKANNDSVNKLRQGAGLNVSVVVHVYDEATRCGPAVRRDTLAAFLVGAGHGCVYACSTAWTFSTGWSVWFPEYDRPLGRPRADAVYTGGVWRRSFESGTLVAFDPATNTGNITWAPPSSSVAV